MAALIWGNTSKRAHAQIRRNCRDRIPIHALRPPNRCRHVLSTDDRIETSRCSYCSDRLTIRDVRPCVLQRQYSKPVGRLTSVFVDGRERTCGLRYRSYFHGRQPLLLSQFLVNSVSLFTAGDLL